MPSNFVIYITLLTEKGVIITLVEHCDRCPRSTQATVGKEYRLIDLVAVQLKHMSKKRCLHCTVPNHRRENALLGKNYSNRILQ